MVDKDVEALLKQIPGARRGDTPSTGERKPRSERYYRRHGRFNAKHEINILNTRMQNLENVVEDLERQVRELKRRQGE